MPSIRHIALMCEDTSAMAEFYKNVFDLHEVWRHGQAVYMSDGEFSLVLLKAREGVKPGINHWGFLVEDMDEIKRRLEENDVPPPFEKPQDGRYAELGAIDPEGNRFDLSVAGWETERSRPDGVA
ncbi:MAG TPA: VOC family protein [Chloroflexota bacterium]|jgi:catechol 2,3-dioxygenase-like lactoylglutathione lyase family enzyme